MVASTFQSLSAPRTPLHRGLRRQRSPGKADGDACPDRCTTVVSSNLCDEAGRDIDGLRDGVSRADTRMNRLLVVRRNMLWTNGSSKYFVSDFEKSTKPSANMMSTNLKYRQALVEDPPRLPGCQGEHL